MGWNLACSFSVMEEEMGPLLLAAAAAAEDMGKFRSRPRQLAKALLTARHESAMQFMRTRYGDDFASFLSSQ